MSFFKRSRSVVALTYFNHSFSYKIFQITIAGVIAAAERVSQANTKETLLLFNY